jgi:hypothetical protein
MQHSTRAQDLVAKIKGLHPFLERLAEPFRIDPKSGKEPDFDKFSADDWRRNTFGNALVRLRQLTENNFNYIESMGLLAVARYVFELSVWLRLFQKDKRYCLVYYRELLQTQKRYYEDTLAHLREEIELLKSFHARDSQATDRVLQTHQVSKSGSDIGEIIRKAMAEVDGEAGRRFSLYLDDAKTNGYGFQAHLVEKKAVPQVESAIEQISQEIQEFESRVPEDIRNFAKGRWEWRAMAKAAGIEKEHDYIYSYASKLLHATPASLTTDQKNLEMAEVCLFLRYIYAKSLEIMELARKQPEC